MLQLYRPHIARRELIGDAVEPDSPAHSRYGVRRSIENTGVAMEVKYMKVTKRTLRWSAVALMVGSIAVIAGIACGGGTTTEPAPTARPTATPVPRQAPEEAAPAPTAMPAATVAMRMEMEEEREVTLATRRVSAVIGLPTIGPYAGTPTVSGGVEEYFFHFENGDPMTPELIESWDIDSAGTRFRFTMKRGADGNGIPFNSPIGFENLDFGVADADAVVRYFNESNATTNPDTTYGNSGDLAAIFLEATKIDEWTVEIGLVSPVFFCLPISQFGCLSAARGLYGLHHADDQGVEWAREHHIATGPFVQGSCVAGDRCTTHQLDDHWRVTEKNIDKFTQIQVPENNTRIAMLKTGDADLAGIDFKLVPGVVQDGYRFLETMPGGFVGQSILFPGLLWEHSHARTDQPLEPWNCENRSSAAIENQCGTGPNEGPYTQDFPWIGNPWGTQDNPCSDGDGPGHERCGNAPYADTNNPAGMDDMEQARLVRLALSIAMDRNQINSDFLNNAGTPIYSEYMGPEYPGWDASRQTGCWDWIGNRVNCPLDPIGGATFAEGVPWEVPNGDLALADELLAAAGYPLVGGVRQGIEDLTLQAYVAEAGEVGLEIADYITSQWEQLGIEISQLIEDYGGVISQRMRRRVQFLPVLKNGDVHSNVYPVDWPLPTVDTSSSRPGWGVGFESQPGGKWLFEILAEKDPAVRTEKHLDWVDYSMYWVQYAGAFQVPKGIIAGPRIGSWNGRQQHYSNVSSNPEFIILR